jgi:hypothetical protein
VVVEGVGAGWRCWHVLIERGVSIHWGAAGLGGVMVGGGPVVVLTCASAA